MSPRNTDRSQTPAVITGNGHAGRSVPFRNAAGNKLEQCIASDDEKMNGSVAVSPEAEPFWRKPLDALTTAEWESLCDGCGRCCLIKLEDEDTGDVHFTSVGCTLLDPTSCRCRDYPNRQARVPDCVRLTRENIATLPWLPRTCAYYLRGQGKDLPDWHPLVSGDPASVARAGISVGGRVAASENDVADDDLPDFIVRWPNRWPRAGRRR